MTVDHLDAAAEQFVPTMKPGHNAQQGSALLQCRCAFCEKMDQAGLGASHD